MSSDSISSSWVPAASNAKSLAKKKKGKGNKSRKLKQGKLDARRKQWLLQVKSKECEELSEGGKMHGRDGMDQGTRAVEVTPKNGEKDGSMHQGEVSHSCLNILSSHSGSVAENVGGGSDDWEAVADALVDTDDKKDQCDQKSESLLENENVVQAEAVQQIISIEGVLKPKPAKLDRTFKSVLENTNVALLNHRPQVVNQPTATVDVSKPKPENGQARRHSDASGSKPKPEFCQAWRPRDAFPSNPNPEKHDQKCKSLVEDKNVTQLDHLPEVVKQPTAPMDCWKPKPENSLAWSQDDAFRPKSLPDLQKMHRFPPNKIWHNRHGGSTSGCEDSVDGDAFRPKSLPDPQKMHKFPPKKNWHNHQRGTTSGCKASVSAPTLCPICCEDMDSSDLNFLPCPCGFQLCIFCHRMILEGEENGRCPGCRKQYDKNAVKWKNIQI